MNMDELLKRDPLYHFHRRVKTPPTAEELKTIADGMRMRQGASIEETGRSLGLPCNFGSPASNANLSREALQFEHAVGIKGIGILAQRILDLEKKVEELQRKGAPVGAEYR